MLIAFFTTFHASKKEPLAELLERIHAAFIASGLGEPAIQFSFADAPVPGFASSVDRVLKRASRSKMSTTSCYGAGGHSARRN
jgi:hypothetical protein